MGVNGDDHDGPSVSSVEGMDVDGEEKWKW